MPVNERPPTHTDRSDTVIWLVLFGAIVLGVIGISYHSKRYGHKSEDFELRFGLKRLREAIAQYHVDTGVYPARLQDLVAPAGSTPQGTKHGAYAGPYLNPHGGIQDTGLPCNSFGDPTQGVATHWIYNPTDGTVKSAVEGMTVNDVPYSQL